MPAPSRPCTPSGRGWRSLAPPNATQQPPAMQSPRIKPDPNASTTGAWAPNAAKDLKTTASSPAGSSFAASGRAISAAPQQSFGSSFGTPDNYRPLSAAAPQPSSGSKPAQVKKVPRVGERSAHAQMFDFGTKVVTVRVRIAPDHQDFTVHENLVKRSPYLMSIYHQSATYIVLPDAQPEAFAIYQQWLYTRGLHTKTVNMGGAIGLLGPSHGEEWTKLTEVYLLGHKLVDIEFQDRVVDGMIEWLQEVTHSAYDLSMVLDSIPRIYTILGEAGEDNPLRRLVSDIIALKFSDAMIQKMAIDRNGEKMPPAFLLDLVLKLSTRLSGPAKFLNASKLPEAREGCHYHCHKEGECYREK